MTCRVLKKKVAFSILAVFFVYIRKPYVQLLCNNFKYTLSPPFGSNKLNIKFLRITTVLACIYIT